MSIKQRLICGSLPDDFDPKSDILVGPWSFLGKEKKYPNWPFFEWEPDPFSSVAELVNAEESVNAWYQDELDQIVIHFNQLNGSNHSKVYWNYFLTPWLITLMQVIWDRSLRVEDLLQKYQNLPLSIELVEFKSNWSFTDSVDFFSNGILGQEFNHWLLSLLIADKAPSNWVFSWRTPLATGEYQEQNPDSQATKSPKDRLKDTLRPYRWPSRCRGVYGVGFFSARWLSLLMFFSSSNENIEPHSSNTNGLENFDKCTAINTHSNLLWKILSLVIPSNYKMIAGLGEKRTPKQAKSSLVSNQFFDDTGRHETALKKEHGEHIISVQHGGYYGNAKVFSVVASHEYSQDNFITWGWKNHGRYIGNFKPLPSPYLSKFPQNAFSKNNESIILVSTRHHAFTYRFDSTPQPGDHAETVKGKIEFISNLTLPVRNNLLYRTFPLGNGSLRDDLILTQKFPWLKYCVGELQPQLNACSLTVLDHPGTTLNINLAANNPTIGFWPKHHWPMSEQAEPFFEKIRDVGIIHTSAPSAAQHINALDGDIAIWWNSVQVQNARIEWNKNFGNTSKIWLWHWTKEIWNM